MSSPESASEQRPTPCLRVVRGDATPEEVAAVVAVLAARARAAQAARAATGQPTAYSAWRDRARLVRAPLRAGPDAWRAVYHPG